jgi:hypothetical protein
MNSPYIAKKILEAGGDIHPLYVPPSESGGTGLMNPSIFIDNGKILVILRNVNYTFYHSEKKLFQHQWGPLTYVHPEHDMHLRTTNHYLELDDNFNLIRHNKIDTSRFDTYEPMWDFVGLEDARIVRWDGKLYITGVRRDTTTNGQGRMELSEIEVTDDAVTEISRFRIPPPQNPDSYCEKNWMPILDKPYHFVKWCNPTEVVKVDPVKETCETVHFGGNFPVPRDLRGGSQVIPYGDYYLTCTHEVDLFHSEVGRKDGVYRHRFIVWDKEWNPVKASKDFSFLAGHVEFCVGMTEYKGDILMTFGFQDNAAYIVRSPKKVIEDIINE